MPLLSNESPNPSSTAPSKKINNSKVAPIVSNATLIDKTSMQTASITPSRSSGFQFKPYTVASSSSTSATASSKGLGKDDKKKENVEKKKEEKLKQKAEKAAKKVSFYSKLIFVFIIFLSIKIKINEMFRKKKDSLKRKRN